jgi:hypothetical protein
MNKAAIKWLESAPDSPHNLRWTDIMGEEELRNGLKVLFCRREWNEEGVWDLANRPQGNYHGLQPMIAIKMDLQGHGQWRMRQDDDPEDTANAFVRGDIF